MNQGCGGSVLLAAVGFSLGCRHQVFPSSASGCALVLWFILCRHHGKCPHVVMAPLLWPHQKEERRTFVVSSSLLFQQLLCCAPCPLPTCWPAHAAGGCACRRNSDEHVHVCGHFCLQGGSFDIDIRKYNAQKKGYEFLGSLWCTLPDCLPGGCSNVCGHWL